MNAEKIYRQTEKEVPTGNVLAAAAAASASDDVTLVDAAESSGDEQDVDPADAALFKELKPNKPTVRLPPVSPCHRDRTRHRAATRRRCVARWSERWSSGYISARIWS